MGPFSQRKQDAELPAAEHREAKMWCFPSCRNSDPRCLIRSILTLINHNNILFFTFDLGRKLRNKNGVLLMGQGNNELCFISY